MLSILAPETTLVWQQPLPPPLPPLPDPFPDMPPDPDPPDPDPPDPDPPDPDPPEPDPPDPDPPDPDPPDPEDEPEPDPEELDPPPAVAIWLLIAARDVSAAATEALTELETLETAAALDWRDCFSCVLQVTDGAVAARPVAKAKTLVMSLLVDAAVRPSILASTSAQVLAASASALACLLPASSLAINFSAAAN